MEQAPEYVIEMLHITKEFPGIKANDDITLQLKKGEIHALLGENGAGKSTLISRSDRDRGLRAEPRIYIIYALDRFDKLES